MRSYHGLIGGSGQRAQGLRVSVEAVVVSSGRKLTPEAVNVCRESKRAAICCNYI
ncbi:hypothetical protein [Paenibacillus beijingensis]|uniref:hypothetical protein n=1 Tax=Paenibacillus beijingensis TaxID=1126833 RepID=UPI000AC156E1|nr:hypothetical protein [Paenibacillus beijingensis]